MKTPELCWLGLERFGYSIGAEIVCKSFHRDLCRKNLAGDSILRRTAFRVPACGRKGSVAKPFRPQAGTLNAVLRCCKAPLINSHKSFRRTNTKVPMRTRPPSLDCNPGRYR